MIKSAFFELFKGKKPKELADFNSLLKTDSNAKKYFLIELGNSRKQLRLLGKEFRIETYSNHITLFEYHALDEWRYNHVKISAFHQTFNVISQDRSQIFRVHVYYDRGGNFIEVATQDPNSDRVELPEIDRYVIKNFSVSATGSFIAAIQKVLKVRCTQLLQQFDTQNKLLCKSIKKSQMQLDNDAQLVNLEAIAKLLEQLIFNCKEIKRFGQAINFDPQAVWFAKMLESVKQKMTTLVAQISTQAAVEQESETEKQNSSSVQSAVNHKSHKTSKRRAMKSAYAKEKIEIVRKLEEK